MTLACRAWIAAWEMLAVESSYALYELAWEARNSSAWEALNATKFLLGNEGVKILLVTGEEAVPESPRKIGIGLFNENCQETVERKDDIQWRDGEVTAVLGDAW